MPASQRAQGNESGFKVLKNHSPEFIAAKLLHARQNSSGHPAAISWITAIWFARPTRGHKLTGRIDNYIRAKLLPNFVYGFSRQRFQIEAIENLLIYHHFYQNRFNLNRLLKLSPYREVRLQQKQLLVLPFRRRFLCGLTDA